MTAESMSYSSVTFGVAARGLQPAQHLTQLNFFVQRLVQEGAAAPGSSHTGKPPGPACPHPRVLLASGRGIYWHPKGQSDDVELNMAALPETPLRPAEPTLCEGPCLPWCRPDCSSGWPALFKNCGVLKLYFSRIPGPGARRETVRIIIKRTSSKSRMVRIWRY